MSSGGCGKPGGNTYAAGAPEPQPQPWVCAAGEHSRVWDWGKHQAGSVLTALPASQEGLVAGGALESPPVEAMLRELGELWEDLQRKHQENGAVLREIDKVHGGRAGVGTGACPNRNSFLGLSK